jgi:ABC-type glycerol-3-phosphate transport system substrate-binding protein
MIQKIPCDIGFAIILLSLILVFSACSKSVINEKKGFNKVVDSQQINWIGHWKNEGLREQLVKEVANEFEFLHQDIRVNLKFPEEVYFKNNGNDDEIDFIIKAIQSDKPQWDIIRIKDFYSNISVRLKDPDWGRKYLVDFSEFPDFVDHHQKFLFNDDYKQQNGGITVGPYNEGFFWAVWYNKNVADKMGITIKQFGMTDQDFIGYIKSAYAYNKSHNTQIVPLYEEANWITSENLVLQLFYSSIGSMDELNKKEYDPRKMDKLEEIFKIFEEISNYEPTFKNRSNIFWGKTYDYPLKGKCLFYVQGSWMYNIWDAIDKEGLQNMVPAELPSIKSSSPCYIGGYKACWAVPKNAPHRDAAIKLMKFWASAAISEKWVRYTKCPTGIKGNLTATTFGFDTYENFEYTISKKYVDRMINPVDNRFIFGIKNKDLRFSIIDIIEKRKTATQAIQEIKRNIKL